MQFDNLFLEFDGPIGRLTITRAKVLNALSLAVLEDLKRALWAVWSQPSCSVLILTGEGDKAFVAGADIAEMSRMTPTQASAFADLGHNVCGMLERMPAIVIAAVNGFALGGGCELALACDLVIASTSAVFGQPEVRLGIIPGFGGTARLPRAIGLRAALEWIAAGERFPAEEAHRLGLVNHVVAPGDLLPTADRLARAIASRGPRAVAAAKRLVRDGMSVPQDAALRTEAAVFATLFDSTDQKEGMSAFLEKRSATFTGK